MSSCDILLQETFFSCRVLSERMIGRATGGRCLLQRRHRTASEVLEQKDEVQTAHILHLLVFYSSIIQKIDEGAGGAAPDSTKLCLDLTKTDMTDKMAPSIFFSCSLSSKHVTIDLISNFHFPFIISTSLWREL